MTRTLISLDEDTKRWLDQRARQEGVAMTVLVRRGVQLLRERDERSVNRILEETSGIWKSGDGLKRQQALRDEWDRK